MPHSPLVVLSHEVDASPKLLLPISCVPGNDSGTTISTKITASESKLTDHQKDFILKRISEYLTTWDYHNNSYGCRIRAQFNNQCFESNEFI